MTPDADFRPTATWPLLQRRAALLRQVRAFFDERGFTEVETPLLSADTVVDRHLDPLEVRVVDDPRRPTDGRTMFLQTSPEFGMKRLLAAGADAIYQVTRAFRGGERGPQHNLEFTIVEWYRVGDDYAAGIALLAELASRLLARPPAETLTYHAAFARWVGVDPFAALVAELAVAAERLGISAPASFAADDRDSWLDLLLCEAIQPHLGRSSPTILIDWPVSQAALARVRDDEPPVAERFELYVDGVELANGYHELLDADVLRARAIDNNRRRQQDGKPALPEENRLLAAMRAGLPPCAGCALGFDRLAMVAFGVRSLAEVLAFPESRA